MGDEVSIDRFDESDFLRFQEKLSLEMDFVRDLFATEAFEASERRLGYELELCLIDARGEPMPCNQAVLDAIANPLFTYELARYNLEINGNAFAVAPEVFDCVNEDMHGLYQQVDRTAQRSPV